MTGIQLLITLSLGIFCPPILGIANPPQTGDEQDCPQKVAALRVHAGDSENDVLIKLNGLAEVNGDEPHFLFVTADADDDSKPHVMAWTSSAGDLKAGGPWIGVQFGPVSKPLAAQLRLKDGVGQMIGNVMVNSPADVAGFQQYDVLTAVDGQEVSGNIEDFLDKVRSFKPGETHAFTILRGGQTVTSNVVIGERPAADNMPKNKFPSEFEELSGGQVFGRSGLLEKDPQGNWMFKGFNVKDLPNVWSAIPDVDDMDFDFHIPGPGTNQVYVNKVDGKTVRIEKNKDGQITVTRTEKNDGDKSTSTTTYNSEGELQAADPEAYKMLQEGPTMQFFGMQHLPGMQRFRIHESLKNSEEALKRLEERFQHLHQQPGAPGKGMFLRKLRSRTNFETMPDGSIKVIIRNGEDELVQNFEHADAMKNSRPELYEKYQQLHEQAER